MNIKVDISVVFVLLILFQTNINFSQQLESLNHNGQERTYNLFIPSGWDNSQELPLLVVLHGLTQIGAGVMDITQFNVLAEQDNFIACYPSGIDNAWNANMNVSVSSADDFGFLEYLLNDLINQFNIDESRIYFCGFSNGGFMSLKMLCESSICIAGVASVSATMSDTVFDNCSSPKPSSILQIHGTADLVVPYNGSPSTGISVPDFLEFWSEVYGCGSTTDIVDIPNINVFDFSTAQEISYVTCIAGNLKHVKVDGGGHQWPGIETWNGGVGTINLDFNSPEFIWDFLKTKSCDLNEFIEEDHRLLEFFPNPSHGLVHILSSEKNYSLRIYDVQGKIVCKEEISSYEADLKLKSGLFFIEYKSEGGVTIRKKVNVL